MKTRKWAPFTLDSLDEYELAVLATDTPKAIGLGGARQLRRLTRLVQPFDILEIGTYTGMSTKALLPCDGYLFTCDTADLHVPFDLLGPVRPFRATESTEMLRRLLGDGHHEWKVDLVFYDASVRKGDPGLLEELTHPQTVFAFHDYRHYAKGVRGVEAMRRIVPDHVLVEPENEDDVSASVAVLAPAGIAEQIGC